MKYDGSIGKEALKILYDTVSIPSYTNTDGERLIEEYLLDYLSRIDYFKVNGDHYGIKYLSNDRLKRGIVWALYIGKSKDTTVLINHNDVVDTKDFGSLKDLAHKPDELKKALINYGVEDSVKADLEGDDWIFGRGSADMKGGLSVQLALVKYLAENGYDKSVLFLTQCDEETISTGMRESIDLMMELKEKYDLSYDLMINSEPHERSDRERFKIYEGSVGKTMAFVYIRGKKTHIGDIYRGVNPSLILSKIVVDTEVNNEFSDVVGTEVSPPPSWSFARDFKYNYDASIPQNAGGYISFLTYTRTPVEILNSLKDICDSAMEQSLMHIRRNYEKHHGDFFNYNVRVKTFDELYEEVSGYEDKKEITKIFEDVIVMIDNKEISIPESNFVITERMLNLLQDKDPTIIVGLSPPYYPHVVNESKVIKDKLKNLMKWGEENNCVIDKDLYFMGISDLSYASYDGSEEDIKCIENNMPLMRYGKYKVSLRQMKELKLPVVDIGPWGMDYHKYTERVYRQDIVENTPRLILYLLNN